MDRMYRFTRHVYDASRKYYLLGRDALLREMSLHPGDLVVEVGCGTARNLILLGRHRPEVQLLGVDASELMLQTAQSHIDRAGLHERITLRQGLAEQLSPRETFGLDRPFDAVFFSYSLSMIPTWRESIEAALHALRPGGVIYIVDFWDQAGLPRWFAAILKFWLARFGVHHRPELLSHLQALHDQGLGELTIRPYARRYALIACFAKPAPLPR